MCIVRSRLLAAASASSLKVSFYVSLENVNAWLVYISVL